MKKKEKTIYGLIGSILLLVLVVGTSYAYIKYDEKEAGYNTVGTNCIKITLQDKSSEINLKNAYPVEDEVGKTSKPYQFSITNECDVPVSYQVNLEVHRESSIDAGNIAVLFDNADTKHILGTNDEATPIDADDKSDIKESHKVGEGSVRGHETVYHEVRLWLDKNATNETQEQTFKCRVAIEAIQNPLANYKEDILNGADPVLDTEGELIPVKIDESGIVTKADPSKEWYKYEKQQWANAVILNENGKKKMFAYEEEIPEDDIESYFVWIPKYSYKLFDENLGNYNGLVTTTTPKEQPIEIQFGLRNTINSLTECETPMNEDRTQGLSGESGSCAKGKLMTHPTFISFDVNGFWVGKFETGYKGATTTKNAELNTSSSSNIVIKSNQYSWRGAITGNMFKAARDYKSDLTSHMMKNTEWGAVAYLSHSNYGTCTDGSCTEIRINNSSSFLTGVAAIIASNTGYGSYTNYGITAPNVDNSISKTYPKSSIASTTLNNSGIFDMSGGAWELMASAMTNSNNPTSVSQIPFEGSGFSANDIPSLSYVDLYATGTVTQYNRRILGDATGESGSFSIKTYGARQVEISSWYDDEADFVNSTYKWFLRGGHHLHGTGSGVFSFLALTGTELNDNVGFRIVLAVR